MCGIFFSCSLHNALLPEREVRELLQSRGPDSSRTLQRTVHGKQLSTSADGNLTNHTVHLTFSSTVLSLRGDDVVVQPLLDESSGSILCWNGEAWKLHGEPVYDNDAKAVFEAILASTQACHRVTAEHVEERKASYTAVKRVIDVISGPFSFVFYDASSQLIYYGRDRLGRRSLLRKSGSSKELIISSVCEGSVPGMWEEIEADSVFVLDITSFLIPREYASQAALSKDLSMPSEDAVRLSTLVTTEYPLNPPSRREPDYNRATQKLTAQLDRQFPAINKVTLRHGSLKLSIDSEPVTDLYEKLRDSLALRVKDIRPPPSTTGTPARLAVLFSGGLDCTVLTRMIHDLLPFDQAVDLLNVAFENPRVLAAATAKFLKSEQRQKPAYSTYDSCPDRVTGISSYNEVLKVCPDRLWRFISIDVPYTETMSHRSQIISLIHPHDTEMDLSIACALYFASRGHGKIHNPATGTSEAYATPARILISGLGADELFGGYTRHATAFKRGGYQSLLKELQLDFSRLGKRNLGRDDRVISHWGKEARYPYLDEDFVTWALEVPVYEKCSFEQEDHKGSTTQLDPPQLDPSKHILRLLAWKLDMRGAALEPKRAIQFGTRTAKMTAGRTKGTQVISQ